VGLDRRDAEVQIGGNLRVGFPLGDGKRDIAFAGAKPTQ
jgi:hypothetical protein